ncbi:DedA family protein [Roseomonas sp. BN140053]|uniref:DedA family protein n=1 Tax=Roseomonas sp. BN140053 TaxID=3391898 RepID=UPI0039EC4E15
MIAELVSAFNDWIAANAAWAPLVMLIFAFLESLPVLGAIIPATPMLLGIGALIGAGTLEPVPMLGSAIVGAILGDAVSYWGARAIGGRALRRRLPPKYRTTYARGVLMFRRWGVAAIFIGRFFGPLRAMVPAIAGIVGMRERRFQAANIGSALVWAPAVLLPGYLLGWVTDLLAHSNPEVMMAAGAAAALLLAAAWYYRCRLSATFRRLVGPVR